MFSVGFHFCQIIFPQCVNWLLHSHTDKYLLGWPGILVVSQSLTLFGADFLLPDWLEKSHRYPHATQELVLLDVPSVSWRTDQRLSHHQYDPRGWCQEERCHLAKVLKTVAEDERGFSKRSLSVKSRSSCIYSRHSYWKTTRDQTWLPQCVVTSGVLSWETNCLVPEGLADVQKQTKFILGFTIRKGNFHHMY